MVSCTWVSAVRICEGMSSGPSTPCTSRSAFSWISSEAEVWRQKMVRRPVAIRCFASHPAISAVISTNSLPDVDTAITS